jgi:hypothetical protein
MSDVVEVDAATGEVTERPFTPDELTQRQKDQAAAAAAAQAAAAKQTADAAARIAALAHARSLGFTDEMIAVMYPGLIEAAISPTEPEPTFADLTKRDEPPIVDP